MWDINGNWVDDTVYGRWSINMFLFKGSEMRNVTKPDDEAQITTVSLEQGLGLVHWPAMGWFNMQ